MTVTAAEAMDKYLGIANEDFKPDLIFSRFMTNRDYEGTLGDDTEKLRLSWPTTNYTRPTVSTSRDLVIPNHAGSDIAEVELEVNRSYSHSEFERNLDILEGPPTLLPTVIRDTDRIIAEAVEADVLAAWLAGLVNANDGENTSTLRYGTAANYVDDVGEPSTAAARLFYNTLVRRVGSTFRAKNFWKLNAPNYDERQPMLITDNEMWTAFQTYIDDDKPTEQLVNTFMRSDGVEISGSVGVWKDVPNFITTELPLFEVSSKDYHQTLITNPAGMTMAMKTPTMVVDPGPVVLRKTAGSIDMAEGWTIYRRVTLGRVVKNNSYLFRFLTRAEA